MFLSALWKELGEDLFLQLTKKRAKGGCLIFVSILDERLRAHGPLRERERERERRFSGSRRSLGMALRIPSGKGSGSFFVYCAVGSVSFSKP